jgi:hypothetical protein
VFIFTGCEEYTLPKYGNYLSLETETEEQPEDGQFASIRFNIPEAQYTVTTGNILELKAEVKGDIVRDPVYSWKLNGKELSDSLDMAFKETGAGVYDLVFSVTAENGTAEKIFRVTVREKPSNNALLYFDYGKYRNELTPAIGTYTVPKGRHLVISPVRHFRQLTDSTKYEWALDGVIQRQDALPPHTLFPCYFNFDSSGYEAGEVHTVTVYAYDRNRYGSFQAAAETRVEIAPEEGTYKREVTSSSKALSNRLFEFTPAPGQFISASGTSGYPPVAIKAGRTEEEVRAETEAYMLGWDSEWTVSLGAWGGYIVTCFDHSVNNVPGQYSFSIEGNPLGSDWSEPGIVWVSQDENGNRLADDTWFELRASETGKEGTTQRYSVTYRKPDPAQGIVWEDNTGSTGTLPYNRPSGGLMGWPWHTGGDTVTFTGTVLPSHLFVKGNTPGLGMVSHNPYPYGYVDNGGEIVGIQNVLGVRMINHFRISDAMHADGTPADLSYIDFVKVQCAVLVWGFGLGEVSTETGWPVDYVMSH